MIKMTIQIIAGILLVFIVGVIVFIKTAPQFGARSEGERLDRILSSPNYRDGKFQNLVPTVMSGENTSMFGNMIKFIKGGKNREPKVALQTAKFDKDDFINSNSGISYTWFGHSTVLINMNGKIILTDPVFSEAASPVSFMGAKRFKYTNQFEVEQLPDLDVVLISHDHYDHLDYKTIVKLKDKVKIFYVPLGIAAHLLRWGVDEEKIVELDWWEESEFDQFLKFAATPSRHFSGRAGVDKDNTLWCSWVIKTDTSSIYFSGDSGYEKHFKRIGEKYGPFDLTMIECGQYNEGWPYIHMMPEQSVQAHLDLKGKVMMPIHWGKFNLSLHQWTEPIERASKEAERLGVEMISPLPGEIVKVKTDAERKYWWRKQQEMRMAM
jgi:L-ascorbate metabolism protein UlaG (beta-lactamase superfamily)